MKNRTYSQSIIDSRYHLRDGAKAGGRPRVDAEEGGCGVTGFACNIPVSGRHIFEPSVQMHNRGNGKGGGLAAVGLTPSTLGVDQKTLDEDFLLQVALLDETVLPEMEERFIRPYFRVDHEAFIDTVDDYRDIPGLEMKPPAVKRYFVRVKPEALAGFRKERNLGILPEDKVEEEFIYQNTYQLNLALYSSLGEKRAFVLSHGRDMMILKIVGYAEQVAQYYKLDNFDAHIWIAHQRYPTKGRVWHPGGAHPFIGLDEALVHNGDFANYYSVTEYLKQRNIYPLFLTDTEVSVQIFDLLNRVYGYPLEYIIEALAPTAEMDFDHLPEEKQRIYRRIQAAHIHGSPDGPWFFIIARTDVKNRQYQLIGITDTAMLRPQVFAIQKGDVEIGLICSEKQAIDATLESLAKEDPRFGTVADHYWNARGGSYTDGGAFIFTVSGSGNGHKTLTCSDKFGRQIDVSRNQRPCDLTKRLPPIKLESAFQAELRKELKKEDIEGLFSSLVKGMPRWDYRYTGSVLTKLNGLANSDALKGNVIRLLTLFLDRRYPTGKKRRRSILQMATETLHSIFNAVPLLGDKPAGRYGRIDFEKRRDLRPPLPGEEVLVTDADGFPPEGDDSFAQIISEAYRLGWKRFICFGLRGQRFLGCGLGPETDGIRIDAYDSTGDYLASGIDGLEIYVHGNAQDQLGQILKRGKLVVYGDVGQTFMYGAKGGEVYVLGNAAGRPLINAVGRPRVIINGTALDFLAESFMAGDPYNGGGFVIVNGLAFDPRGCVIPQDTPYPGSNLFSLASGGAIFIRDPYKNIVPEQLNGGQILPFDERDWELILPYLKENERLFGISVNRHLLTVDGKRRKPGEVYRTIGAVKLSVLASSSLAMSEEWVTGKNVEGMPDILFHHNTNYNKI
jgi:glutamate synthase domain-containing protein 1/glutamate synthase domain-containing protein 3